MMDSERDLGGGATVRVEWKEGEGGRVYADASLTSGDTTLTATFAPPDGLESLDDWCPGAPMGVILQWSNFVPSGEDHDARGRSNGVTSFVWTSSVKALSTVVKEWNSTHRDAAEVLLRERLAAQVDTLPAVPARGGKGAYYSTILTMHEYAKRRCDYPLKMLGRVTGLSPSTLRGQLARARELSVTS